MKMATVIYNRFLRPDNIILQQIMHQFSIFVNTLKVKWQLFADKGNITGRKACPDH